MERIYLKVGNTKIKTTFKRKKALLRKKNMEFYVSRDVDGESLNKIDNNLHFFFFFNISSSQVILEGKVFEILIRITKEESRK